MLYRYLAYDSHGAKFEGEIDAAGIQQAKQSLAKQNLVLVTIEEAKPEETTSVLGFKFGGEKLSLKDLEFITSELAILLKSGVRIDRGLEILKKGMTGGSQALLQKLASSVKSGNSVAESFAEHPDAFNPLFINMIKLGEASGTLDEVFAKLASELKFRRELQSKIIQSLTYPAVILFVCIGCILFVFNYIVPQMSSMFDRNDDLPVYTEVLLGLSDWFIQYQWYLAAGLLLAAFAFHRALQNEQFRRRVDEFGLAAPIIGKGILLVERIRFNSSMAMSLSSGVSLVDALQLATGNVKNNQVASSLEASKKRVKQGEKLSNVLKNVPLYNDFSLSLVEVGEETGNLEPVFDEISSRARMDFESWTKTLTNMIEPILILVMGGIVGSVVVVMLLSIVGTNDIGL